MTKGELALLLFLAISPGGASRLDLAEALSPTLDPEAFARSLKVLVHRLRNKIGKTAIETLRDGYRLRPDIATNLRSIEAFVRTGDFRDASIHRDGLRYYERLRSRKQRHELRTFHWFDPTERRLHRIEVALGLALARAALDRGDDHVAIDYAGDVLALEPSEAGACELLVAAHLGQDRRLEAWSAYHAFARHSGLDERDVTLHKIRQLFDA